MTDKKQNRGDASLGDERSLRPRGHSAPMKPKTALVKKPNEKFQQPDARGKKRSETSDRPMRGAAQTQKLGRSDQPQSVKDKAFVSERIAKVMARAGVCSRRDAEAWIETGRVSLNGRVLKSPAINVGPDDQIDIDGAPLPQRERTRLFLFHKPSGLVTSAHDPEGRPTVFAFLNSNYGDLPRVVSVGRLDINTEGLLLVTNDGGLARALELPATGWTRRYRVRAHGHITQAQLDVLRQGVTIDSVKYAPIEALLERVQGANAWIAMTLTEGKNREVKRVMEHLGLDVTRLIRVSYGPFQLNDLTPGAIEEVKLKVLRDQLGKNLAELAGVDFSSPLRTLSASELQQQRERLDARARKHVSVLRKEREEKGAKGPRVRIERSATADRRGRAIPVERISSPSRKEDDSALSRNARRFQSLKRNDGKVSDQPSGVSRKQNYREDNAEPQSQRSVRSPRTDNRRGLQETKNWQDKPKSFSHGLTASRSGSGERAIRNKFSHEEQRSQQRLSPRVQEDSRQKSRRDDHATNDRTHPRQENFSARQKNATPSSHERPRNYRNAKEDSATRHNRPSQGDQRSERSRDNKSSASRPDRSAKKRPGARNDQGRGPRNKPPRPRGS